LFSKSADMYDSFYGALGKDYDEEAATVLRLARRTVRRPQSLLDVACGTGRHLEVFARTVGRCAGIDLDPAMLDIARARVPQARLEVADMVGFDLGERFDVVTCLFSSVGYVGTIPRLRRAIASMAAHLTDRGVLVVEPWFQPEDWHRGHVGALFVDEPDRKAARTSRSSQRGAIAVIDFDYLVTDASGSRYFAERHELRLFRWADYVDAFARAGLDVEIDDYGLFGRGLLIGRRRR
jgi:SAM-dependent methyltransferase